jgi:DMSO/TMAO reductase YedYZ molybdopterin-dependent catalytic subunit
VEGISLEELQLAARNHGMPLEALRFPITPVGLHYLLIHYDVPVVDAADWRLTVAGAQELSLGLDDLRARPTLEVTATMECAGNGRARLDRGPEPARLLEESARRADRNAAGPARGRRLRGTIEGSSPGSIAASRAARSNGSMQRHVGGGASGRRAPRAR